MTLDFAPPPSTDELASFPKRTLRKGRRIFRLHHRELNPFWFAATHTDDEGGNRFDLAPPNGASYWALQPVVALLETLVRRPVTTINTELLDRYSITTAPLPRDLTHVANLPVKAARRFGLTAEIHTTADRRATRSWANALHQAGHSALISLPRHDVTGRHRALTLWGPMGEHAPYAWNWTTETTAITAAVTDELALWGIRVVPIPFEVPTIAPPSA